MKTPLRQRQSGVSLVEACVCTAIVAVSAGVVAPNFQLLREHRQVEAAAAQFETDMQFARSLATMHNASVHIRFRSDEAGSCYVVHTGPSRSCDCRADGSTTCSDGATSLRGAGFARTHAPDLESSSASILIDATRGTVTPTTTVKVRGASGATLHQVVSLMGRTRTCSPGRSVPGHPAC